MAVVVDPSDVEEFLKYAGEENLEAVEVAVVTADPRLVLIWRDKEIVNISRAFLNTNGAHQETDVAVDIPEKENRYFVKEQVSDVRAKWLDTLADLNCCSQKGLVEMFDSSIGAGSGADALRRKVSADRDTGYGSQAACAEGTYRYCYDDELRI